MKHINLTNWRGSITDWTKLNYIYGGLDDSYAVKGNLRIDKDNYNYVEFRESKNLFDKDSYNYSNKYYNGVGTLTSATDNSMHDEAITVSPNTQYTFSINTAQAFLGVAFFNDSTFISKSQVTGATSITFTTPNNCNKIYVNTNYNTQPISANYLSTIKPMLNEGSTALTYEPYFEGKKYVINEKLGIIDLSSLNYTYDNDVYKRFFVAIPTAKPVAQNTNKANISCKIYETKPVQYIFDNLTVDKLIGISNNKTLTIRNLSYNDVTAFKEAMSGVMLIYELDKPVIEVVL